MAFSGPREDREAIRELYDRMSDSSACRDLETFLGCFAENGEWNTTHFQRVGREELRAQWHELWQGFDRVGVLCQVGSIEVDGDRASSRCVVHEVVTLKSGSLLRLTGQYLDDLVRENGVWVFARRKYGIIAQDPPA